MSYSYQNYIFEVLTKSNNSQTFVQTNEKIWDLFLEFDFFRCFFYWGSSAFSQWGQKFFSRICKIFAGFCPKTPCFSRFSRSGPVFPGFPGAVGTLVTPQKLINCGAARCGATKTEWKPWTTHLTRVGKFSDDPLKFSVTGLPQIKVLHHLFQDRRVCQRAISSGSNFIYLAYNILMKETEEVCLLVHFLGWLITWLTIHPLGLGERLPRKPWSLT